MVVRQGLRALLSTEEDIEVIAEAETGREAVDLARQLQPNIVLMDIVMPSLNGLEAARQICKQVPATKVLILSSYSDEEYVQRLNEIGARGYLIKQSAADDLLRAIREVQKGKKAFSPSIASRFQDVLNRPSQSEHGNDMNQANRLTPREAEALQLIAEGKTNKEIAAELGISAKTVEKHRQQVMNKLRIHDVAGLTRYALSKGIIKSSTELRLA